MDDHINSDYKTDILAWINHQVELLRARRLDELDLENLIEEIACMGIDLKHELEHRMELLIMHLLKCKYQPERVSGSWRGTIREQRRRITRLLKDAPSLARTVDDYLDESYTAAAARAADETGLPPATFPPTNPFSKQQVFDPDFLP